MNLPELVQSDTQSAVVERFIIACQQDQRVVAAFLGGSYAKGTADAYSDLDLYLILKDSEYDSFLALIIKFIMQLGEPLFLERYDQMGFALLLFIFADGTEGELGVGRESHFTHIHGGAFKMLVDKNALLANAAFPLLQVPEDEQIEKLHGLVVWFWHDLQHHFMIPLARGELWSAYGALEDLRRTCVNLARLRQNFSAPADGYEKLEQAVPVEFFAPLQNTFCALEPKAMLGAAIEIVHFYQMLAPTLAKQHGIPYSYRLEHLVLGQLHRVLLE